MRFTINFQNGRDACILFSDVLQIRTRRGAGCSRYSG